ncbi:hypothetical protein EAI_15817 [Harpegnathos saltator]|uniref:Uncharacterized protein n=1 Tax=Harpegnathos saltator TaxID=610380 RepID=E2C1D2_HARSA|nr:hypothetical protein EAI_15817 [Harpegnathos saltator]
MVHVKAKIELCSRRKCMIKRLTCVQSVDNDKGLKFTVLVQDKLSLMNLADRQIRREGLQDMRRFPVLKQDIS